MLKVFYISPAACTFLFLLLFVMNLSWAFIWIFLFEPVQNNVYITCKFFICLTVGSWTGMYCSVICKINGLCNIASYRLKAFMRIRKFLSTEQANLSKAYIVSIFKYFPLIWVFYSKTANSLINDIQKRTLRLAYQMGEKGFEDLL